jgi:hypothetical protein
MPCPSLVPCPLHFLAGALKCVNFSQGYIKMPVVVKVWDSSRSKKKTVVADNVRELIDKVIIGYN